MIAVERFALVAGAVGLLAMMIPGSATARETWPKNVGDFRLGIQTWTFHSMSFEDSLKKAKALGVCYVETFPGQRLTDAQPQTGMGPGLSKEDRAQVKDMLKKYGIRITGFGVNGISTDEKAARDLFQFVKDMGIPVLVAEPEYDALPMVSKLAKEYGVKVAIHNHPTPSPYADPNFLKSKLQGLDKKVGSCSDVGHWLRSGFEAVPSLKLLSGRVVELHLKDINADKADVPFGTGRIDYPGVFKQLKADKFDGFLSIEYEGNQPDPEPQVRQSIAYLKKLLEK